MKHKLLTIAAAVLTIPFLLAGQALANEAAPGPQRSVVTNFRNFSGIGAPAAYPDLIVTAKQPVEVPGKVLQPGQYTFRLINLNNEVTVASANKTVGIFPVVPALRMHPSGNGLVRTEKSPAGGPDRISEWFFPGQSDGYQLVYPRTTQHIRTIAKAE